MQLWQAILLGFIQGLTEFFPISSSGHLVLLQNWLQIQPPPFYFDVFIHLISLIAIVYYFRNKLWQIAHQSDYKTLKLILIATLPILVVGFFIQQHVESIFSSTLIAGAGLLITAGLNFCTAYRYQLQTSNNNQKLTSNDLTWLAALKIGLLQILAILPGISRSGSTLLGGSLVNLSRQEAFEFSFLLAIPTILAANIANALLSSFSNPFMTNNINFTLFLIGGSVCLITSLICLNLLQKFLKQQKYHVFGWYCLILGIMSIFIRLI
jgi:undecaprenyl-diphosphatase